MNRLFSLLTSLILVLSTRPASAHITYGARNLGTFEVAGTMIIGSNNNGTLINSGTSASVTIANQNVTGDYGWADGTDARFGDSHELRAFQFTLLTPAVVTIDVTGLSYVAGMFSFSALDHPALSLYQGLAHLPPDKADHDQSDISQAWVTSLVGADNYDGTFNALGDWKIGNDDGTTFADLSSFIYMGNAADGTQANYGSAPGINGDGNADGAVRATFHLAAGDYTLFVGGGNYDGSSTSSLGIQTTITVVPEPSSLLLAVAGLVLAGYAARGFRERRRPEV